MKERNVIFRDSEIVEFCKATHDTNEIHDPTFMSRMGKRVIVPGMFALSRTLLLAFGFLKNDANYIKVLFNSLLSSGDFATLRAERNPADPNEIRLSAINHKDTLTSNNEYTRIQKIENLVLKEYPGILRRLEIEPGQVEKFSHLIGSCDPDIAHFLFAVSNASQALLNCIDHPLTETEKEMDDVVNGNSKVSPFYQALEIQIPSPFPVFVPGDHLDYYIHFETEKHYKFYTAYVRCESNGVKLYHSVYHLVGIPDIIIFRMAKDTKPVRK